MPVLPSFALTYQWTRELRRWKPGVLVAAHLRIPDDEPVTVGRYGTEPRQVTAAEAAAIVRDLADPRGYEVFVPRAVTPAEVRRVRQIPQGVGWRYQPDAHGRRPCACPACVQPGTPGSGKLRRAYPYDKRPTGKPQLMANLRAATKPGEIVQALYALYGRRWGGAEELAYLVEHPDQEVREVLADLLRNYRGHAAKVLRHRLAETGTHGADE
ncbi:hypothetical protein ACFQX7_00045 [Luedemannella flava]